MNLGLRWEIIPPFYEVTNRISEVSLSVPDPNAGNRPGALIFEGPYNDTSRFDLSAALIEEADGSWWIKLEYDTALFDDDRITRMLGHYDVLLRSIADQTT